LVGGVSPKVWTVSGVLMHFLKVLVVEHILFDSTYDIDLCSSPSTKHSRPAAMPKMPLH